MWEQGFVLAILLGIITCLLVTKIKPSYVFAGAAFIAFMAGMMDSTTIAANFTNASLLTLVRPVLASGALEKALLSSWVRR
ncbi:SLC13 family permease, partial [Vibrio sp. 2025]|nr:SLC13 family permease [Vibrio sp. 2025]